MKDIWSEENIKQRMMNGTEDICCYNSPFPTFCHEWVKVKKDGMIVKVCLDTECKFLQK